MCGIVGRVTKTLQPSTPLETLRDTLTHRGPDDAGIWRSPDRRVELGHRRLAIVDLSEAGHQPMVSPDQQLQIVFNGEIYNHRELRIRLAAAGYCFHSTSDTEVLLAAYQHWGTECLTHLDGMFAFAIYHAAKQELFLARDRAGEKPLYYTTDRGQFLFASELKALMAERSLPRHLNANAVDAYFTYGFVPGDLCILEGVQKLPQGHALRVSTQTLECQRWRWWTLPKTLMSRSQPQSIDEAADTLHELLGESIRRRLHADVPVGIMLSGGVDSSIITALAAAQSTQPVSTFTVTFPDSGVYNEAVYARQIASHLGTRHHELVAEPSSFHDLQHLAAQYDEPLADSSLLPTWLVSTQIREHATVALGGDGGDELFGGYPHYRWLLKQQFYRRLLPQPMRQLTARWASRLPAGLRGRNHLIGLAGAADNAIAHINLYFDRSLRRNLLAPWYSQHPDQPNSESIKRGLCAKNESLLRQATTADFSTYLVDDILVKVDRASMLASLEVRAPFLAPDIIEFAFSQLRDDYRCTRNQSKRILRILGQRLLPANYNYARKQGFSLPLDQWFKQQWGAQLREILASATPEIFSQDVIQHLLSQQQAGRSNMQRLFAIAFFELWRQTYQVKLPSCRLARHASAA